MVDNILDFSNAEIGKLHLHREQFSAQNLVDECVQILTNQAQKKALKLSWQAEADIIDVVHTDSGRLRQIILNLLDNAIKYADKIEVEINKSNNNVFIKIEDDGPGIPESEFENVFKPFYKIDKGRADTKASVGLGLSIASDIVRSHGGNIKLDKSSMNGLSVKIFLPF